MGWVFLLTLVTRKQPTPQPYYLIICESNLKTKYDHQCHCERSLRSEAISLGTTELRPDHNPRKDEMGQILPIFYLFRRDSYIEMKSGSVSYGVTNKRIRFDWVGALGY